MIAHLKGSLLTKATDSVVIDINGVGYEVFVPLSTFYTLPDEQGNEISLQIHTHVREDAFLLYGFKTIIEKRIFRLLISVSGIGPKLGLNILSGIGPDALLTAIAQGDVVKLQSIPGVGKKTAERIALELKDKARLIRPDTDDMPPIKVASHEDRLLRDDAISALVNLGYTLKAAEKAVDKALTGPGEKRLEFIITEALRVLV
ncbi:MAG: Holliday junction branch migration protein RuvA [Desulfatiglans sp.]|jgi:Holliday junction DNA helicase RuvA|nr:Holliday junction branch migration protein RuvA [Desulfatiglans sp.]